MGREGRGNGKPFMFVKCPEREQALIVWVGFAWGLALGEGAVWVLGTVYHLSLAETDVVGRSDLSSFFRL